MSTMISFDEQVKNEIITNVGAGFAEDNQLGQSLIDFIECNLENWEMIEFSGSIIDYGEPSDFWNYLESFVKDNVKHIFLNSSLTSLADAYSELSEQFYIQNYEEADRIASNMIERLNYGKLQKEFKNATYYCLDENCPKELRDLNNKQRYYLFEQYILDQKSCFIRDYGLYSKTYSSTYYVDVIPLTTDFALPEKSDTNYHEAISIIKGSETIIKEWYECNSVESACLTVFEKMIINEVRVKQCKNCKKYFILNGKYRTEYCNRIPLGENKTCKQIGAKKAYISKLKSDPISQIYDRSYKTHFARIKYGKLSKEEFFLWSQDAILMKDKAKSGEISFELYKEWMKK